MKKIFIFLLVLFIIIFSFFFIRWNKKPDINNGINIVFGIDNNYVLYNLLTVNSILRNNKSGNNYNFYILENGISGWNKFKIKSFVALNNQYVKFINVDTDIIDNGDDWFRNSLEHKHVSRISLARLLLADKLPQYMNQVLYLDSDILVLSDLAELYNSDISEYAAAMTLDVSILWPDLYPEGIPINYGAGVILINLKFWRDNNVTQQFIDYIKSGNEIPKLDQTVINEVLKGKIKTLSPNWNNQTNLDRSVSNDFSYGIIHYIGSNKPWLCFIECNYAQINLYYDNWNHSPFLFDKLKMHSLMSLKRIKET